MITDWIDKMFRYSFNREWYETYWAIDIHGVVLKPTYRRNNFRAHFYPYAKETLKLLSDRKDVILIMFTSSYPEEIKNYIKTFEPLGIHFKYINENPEIDSSRGNFGYYKDKFYFNVLFEDKAGFNPEIEWNEIYNLLKEYECKNYFPNQKWTTKF